MQQLPGNKMAKQTLNRCSNELPNDFRAKLQNPPNFDNFAFGGSLRTNCTTPSIQTKIGKIAAALRK